jgi:hypothetical protein
VGSANAILLASAFWSIGEIEIPNHKSQTNNNDQNSKPVLVIGYWNLRFVCNLVLGA